MLQKQSVPVMTIKIGRPAMEVVKVAFWVLRWFMNADVPIPSAIMDEIMTEKYQNRAACVTSEIMNGELGHVFGQGCSI